MITYPLNEIDYDAADAELFHCTRNSGIYAGTDFQPTVTGADNIVTIGAGIGWIRNSKFSGKVIAEKASTSVNMGVADASLPRIDVVCARFDKNANETTIVAKSGVPASSPVMPTISQTETLYELYFCSVYRKAGAVSITSADVTDLRLDENVCGLMGDSVTLIDTTGINAQINALIEELREEIAGVESSTEIMLKSVYDTNNDGFVDVATHAMFLNGLDSRAFAKAEDLTTVSNTATSAKNTATAAQTAANQAQTTANTAQTTANAAMPKSGGTFIGNIAANVTNREGTYLRNISVRDITGTRTVSTDYIIMLRKGE